MIGTTLAELQAAIRDGRTALGIEFGSTRIKAVLSGPDHTPIAVGAYDWENQFVDRVWTYSDEAIWAGLQDCYAALAADVSQRYDLELETVGALGISAMMHGYLAFDTDDNLLVGFRTWRNTITEQASAELTGLFGHNIPQRWSIAHLYQAILNGEEHVEQLAHLTTLAGYVHHRLTGRRVLGVGDASGMFPIDVATGSYDATMTSRFNALVGGRGFGWKLADLLPEVLPAGASAGSLTEDGARLLDPSGKLRPGVGFCPPEGDAGTGMVATNSVAKRTGNVSAGTSIFAMVVLEGPLARQHSELDLVTTPAGDLVAMVHCNNGASELNAWAGLFAEFAAALGAEAETATVFETLFNAALAGDADAGGLLAYNYLSGEHITGFSEGRPLFVRTPDSSFNLANFIRAQLFAAFASLSIGMRVLTDEGVSLDSLYAHGGLFKTKGVGARILAAALNTPVSVGEIAGEGGAWGIALLAEYARDHDGHTSLDQYLNTEVFATAPLDTVQPEPGDVAGFAAFAERFVVGLAIERAAVEHC
ncbi:MAG: ATPase [Actinobacteria bacterium]|nr:ATPase [Actinomycetota bacterium]MBU4249602.1 ATPase [Actinomycetota bacterium]MBU4364434.1 ATPase [Actinomycetota bacterium]MBU4408721.1 ATPase [Actinomycetota bacterium]MBU4416161.1 ATPase [Actinomycetota bacterium]